MPSIEVQGNLLFPSRAKQQISKSEFEKVLAMVPLDGPGRPRGSRVGLCLGGATRQPDSATGLVKVGRLVRQCTMDVGFYPKGLRNLEGEDIPRLLERTLAS